MSGTAPQPEVNEAVADQVALPRAFAMSLTKETAALVVIRGV